MSDRIDTRSVVRRASRVEFTRLDDEFIGLDTRTGMAHTLNATGGRVWELLSSPVRVEVICDRLSAEFDVDGDLCRSQVVQLLDVLRRAELIELQGSG